MTKRRMSTSADALQNYREKHAHAEVKGAGKAGDKRANEPDQSILDIKLSEKHVPRKIKEWERGPDAKLNRQQEVQTTGWAAAIHQPYVPLGVPELEYTHPHVLLRGDGKEDKSRLLGGPSAEGAGADGDKTWAPFRRPAPKVSANAELWSTLKQSHQQVAAVRAGGWFLDSVSEEGPQEGAGAGPAGARAGASLRPSHMPDLPDSPFTEGSPSPPSHFGHGEHSSSIRRSSMAAASFSMSHASTKPATPMSTGESLARTGTSAQTGTAHGDSAGTQHSEDGAARSMVLRGGPASDYPGNRGMRPRMSIVPAGREKGRRHLVEQPPGAEASTRTSPAEEQNDEDAEDEEEPPEPPQAPAQPPQRRAIAHIAPSPRQAGGVASRRTVVPSGAHAAAAAARPGQQYSCSPHLRYKASRPPSGVSEVPVVKPEKPRKQIVVTNDNASAIRAATEATQSNFWSSKKKGGSRPASKQASRPGTASMPLVPTLRLTHLSAAAQPSPRALQQALSADTYRVTMKSTGAHPEMFHGDPRTAFPTASDWLLRYSSQLQSIQKAEDGAEGPLDAFRPITAPHTARVNPQAPNPALHRSDPTPAGGSQKGPAGGSQTARARLQGAPSNGGGGLSRRIKSWLTEKKAKDDRNQVDEMRSEFIGICEELDDNLRTQLSRVVRSRKDRYVRKVEAFQVAHDVSCSNQPTDRQLEGIRSGAELKAVEKALKSIQSQGWYKKILDIISNSVKRDGTVSHGEQVIVDDITKTLFEGFEYGKEEFKKSFYALWPSDHHCMEVQEMVHILMDALRISRDELAEWCSVLGKEAKREILRVLDKSRKDAKVNDATSHMAHAFRFLGSMNRARANEHKRSIISANETAKQQNADSLLTKVATASKSRNSGFSTSRLMQRISSPRVSSREGSARDSKEETSDSGPPNLTNLQASHSPATNIRKLVSREQTLESARQSMQDDSDSAKAPSTSTPAKNMASYEEYQKILGNRPPGSATRGRGSMELASTGVNVDRLTGQVAVEPPAVLT